MPLFSTSTSISDSYPKEKNIRDRCRNTFHLTSLASSFSNLLSSNSSSFAGCLDVCPSQSQDWYLTVLSFPLEPVYRPAFSFHIDSTPRLHTKYLLQSVGDHECLFIFGGESLCTFKYRSCQPHGLQLCKWFARHTSFKFIWKAGFKVLHLNLSFPPHQDSLSFSMTVFKGSHPSNCTIHA